MEKVMTSKAWGGCIIHCEFEHFVLLIRTASSLRGPLIGCKKGPRAIEADTNPPSYELGQIAGLAVATATG